MLMYSKSSELLTELFLLIFLNWNLAAASDILNTYECYKETIKNEGEIQSIWYPDPFPAGFNCVYRIMAPAGQRVRLTFIEFDLHPPEYEKKVNYDMYETGCQLEYLSINAVINNSADDPVEIYCGNQLEGRSVTSANNKIKMEFNSFYGKRKGFRIKVEFVSSTDPINYCTEVLAHQSQIMLSNIHRNCTLFVKGSHGKPVALEVTSISPPQTDTKCKLRLKEKSNSLAKVVDGSLPLCGLNVLNKKIVSYGSYFDLEVKIPTTVSLTVKLSVPNEAATTCGGVVNMTKAVNISIQVPTLQRMPADDWIICFWHFRVPEGSGMRIFYKMDGSTTPENNCNNDLLYVKSAIQGQSLEEFLKLQCEPARNKFLNCNQMYNQCQLGKGMKHVIKKATGKEMDVFVYLKVHYYFNEAHAHGLRMRNFNATFSLL